MKKTQYTRLIEPLVVIVIGCWFLSLALKINKNPMSVSSTVGNIFAQAKFLPTLMAGLVILLGIALMIQKFRSPSVGGAKVSKEDIPRLIMLVITVAVYIIAVYKIGFKIPTVIYSFIVLFFLNYKSHKWYMILLAAVVFIAVVLFILPKMINIRLP